MSDARYESNSSKVKGPSEEILRALADTQRREMIRCLKAVNVPIAVSDLAREVAAREMGTSSESVAAETVQRVYLQLYHGDVPRFEALGAVEHDRDKNTVTHGENFDRVASLLDAIDQ